jgi:Cupredoxin-like domain
MRKLIILMIVCLFLAACQKKADHANHQTEHQHTENANKGATDVGNYRLDFRSEPQSLTAGEQVKFILTLKDLQGAGVKELEIVHEKPMHLIVVSEDLNEFYHIHPEPQADGSLTTNFTFPNGGKYRLYADFKPKGAAQSVRDFPLQVSGNISPPQELKADGVREKTVDGVRVVMESGELESNKETTLNFTLYDAVSSEFASGIEKYLGESAHFVIISQDLKNFVHAHPVSMENVKANDARMANVPPNSVFGAHVTFPTDGLYKIFVEFKRSGKVSVAPFVVNVKKGGSDKILENAKIPEGAFKIVVSREGFTPKEVSLNKNNFQKLAFLRVDADNCADEVVFPELNITKKLPVGEVVTVELPADKTGELNFTCGMKMYKGKVIIQ